MEGMRRGKEGQRRSSAAREGGGRIRGKLAQRPPSPTNQMMRPARLFFLVSGILRPVDCWNYSPPRIEAATIRGCAPGIVEYSAPPVKYIYACLPSLHVVKLPMNHCRHTEQVLEDENPGLVRYLAAPASSVLIGGDHGEMSKIRAHLHWPGADPNHWDFPPIGGKLMRIYAQNGLAPAPNPAAPFTPTEVVSFSWCSCRVQLQEAVDIASHRCQTRPPECSPSSWFSQ